MFLPSLGEGISNSVLETMAAGLPVVASRAGGMPEAITPGAGLLVEAGDLAQVAAALEAMTDPGRRRTLADGAAEAARRDFDVARQGRVFADAYRSLLGMDRPQGET